MTTATQIDLETVLGMIADGRITIALALDAEGADEVLDDDEVLEALRQHKPRLLDRLAWNHVWADASPRHGWVEWARSLPLDDWRRWRDRAREIMATLPKNLEPAEALEESQRLAWVELSARVGLDVAPPVV